MEVVVSRALNKVMLIGNLGADPEIRNLPSGDFVANFSIATTESWVDKRTQETVERTQWHQIVYYYKTSLADTIQKYIRKGTKIYIEGSLRTDKWVDKNTGAERSTIKVVANEFLLFGGNRSGEQDYSQNNQQSQNFSQQRNNSSQSSSNQNESISSLSTTDLDDEIPF